MRLRVIAVQYVKVLAPSLAAVWIFGGLFHRLSAYDRAQSLAIGGLCVGIALLAIGVAAEPDAYGSNRRRPHSDEGLSPRKLCVTSAIGLVGVAIMIDLLH